MDIKEKGRYVFIREKAKTLKQKQKEKPVPLIEQVQMARAMKEQFVAEKRKEDGENTASEQLEQITQRAVSYYGQETFFTVKKVFDKPPALEPAQPLHDGHGKVQLNKSQGEDVNVNAHVTKERSATSVPLKEKPANYIEIKDKTETSTLPKEIVKAPKVRANTEHKRQMQQKTQTVKAQQIHSAKRSLAVNTAKKTAAKQDKFIKFRKVIESSVKRVSETWVMTAGALLIALLPMLMIFGVVATMFDGGEENVGTEPLSEEVIEYSPYIFAYACEYELEEYVALIKAVMMQESGGRGDDPMQSSECSYNTQYPKSPNGITDPEYSIDVGIQYLKECLELAGPKDPEDIDGISLALQGYNFGTGYISWTKAQYGSYSQLSAMEFSEYMAAQMGWESYGDPYYVSHVLRYYSM